MTGSQCWSVVEHSCVEWLSHTNNFRAVHSQLKRYHYVVDSDSPETKGLNPHTRHDKVKQPPTSHLTSFNPQNLTQAEI